MNSIPQVHPRSRGACGVRRRKGRTGPTGRPPAVCEARVLREFTAKASDQLWVWRLTLHRSGGGWMSCAAAIDVITLRRAGWSIADHLRTALVTDALDTARQLRRP